ncbi:hypothetical protein BGW39_008890 [Mortierella sp. 14UC]|nr:hypothetical protein BGW39_008890 [Mortierella sp. 14UC]
MQLIGGQTHPLDLPEIRTTIASFLTNRDRVSCMQVNQGWFRDFAGSVWHTIAFRTDHPFTQLPPATIAKYGHLVRSAFNVLKERDIFALSHKAINSLTTIGFHISNNALSRLHFFDVVRHNMASLVSIDLSALHITPDSVEEQREDAIYFTNIEMPMSGSKLESLHLCSLTLTRRNFSDILQYSPRLTFVHIFGTILMSHNPSFELFQHQGVKTLVASLDQVWVPDNQDLLTPTLLVHFPQLETWRDPAHSFPSPSIDKNDLRYELIYNCPHLVKVDFERENSDPDEIGDMLANEFVRLEHCTFSYALLNRSSFVGLLEHQETLTHIVLTVPDRGTQPSAADLNPSGSHLVGLILRCFRNLEVFSVEGHQMHIAAAEEHAWVCGGLRELRMRFHELETVQEVDSCLERLRDLRSIGGQGDLTTPDNGDGSIEHRVCLKLLPMRKLKTVWLGTKNCYLATP